MKRLCLILSLLFVLAAARLSAFETYPVWPDVPPGDKAEQYGEGGYSLPVLEWWAPENKTSDLCVIICPGGGYGGVAYEYEGIMPRDYYLSQGITVVMLRYRVPRREGVPKHLPAWQDLQRTVRFVRAHAEQWGINPEKIGAQGFSAGGHLVLMGATTSRTNAYERIDEIDDLPCHLNFAVPIYPAYVLTDGVDNENTDRGEGAEIVDDFAFDEKTPPMCLIHGDGDGYSPLGSVAVYRRLRQMNIPGEIHIFALVNHAWRNAPEDAPVRRYPERVRDWWIELGLL